MSENLPIKIEFVEMPQKLDELLPKLLQMVDEGLVEIQDTIILKSGPATPRAQMLPRTTLHGKAKMMRIFIGEDDRWHGKPLHDAIVESLRAHGADVRRRTPRLGARRGEIRARRIRHREIALHAVERLWHRRHRIRSGDVVGQLGAQT